MFEIASYDPSTSSYKFGRGGFQGGRGADTGEDR